MVARYLLPLGLCKCPGQNALEERPHEVLMVHVTGRQVSDGSASG
jgi:hypothetical protein